MLDFLAVGERIRDLRIKNGYTQDGLAEIVFVTRQAVSRWELGLTMPSIDNIAELCRLFNVSFEYLLCIGESVCFDETDIFKGHSREFVVKSITEGKLKVNLPEVFYLFSPTERLLLLKAVKEKKLKTDLEELSVRLTQKERLYLSEVNRK